MSTKITCKCGRVYKYSGNLEGRRIECKTCGKQYRVTSKHAPRSGHAKQNGSPREGKPVATRQPKAEVPTRDISSEVRRREFKDYVAVMCRCSAKFQISAESVGKTVKCPQCGGGFKVVRKSRNQDKLPTTAKAGGKPRDEQQSEILEITDFVDEPEKELTAKSSAPQSTCSKCQSRLRQVLISKKLTSNVLCVSCNPPNGICPICRNNLRTPKAQQCRHCLASWHNDVGDGTVSNTTVAIEESALSEAYAVGSEELVKRILKLLSSHAENDGLYITPDIPQKKLANAKSNCETPPNDRILGLIDCTVFGSAKNCLMIGCNSLYYHNDWASTRSGTATIPYEGLQSYTFKRDDSHELDLGLGHSLNTAGASCPNDVIVDILRGIQLLVCGKIQLPKVPRIEPSVTNGDSSEESKETLGQKVAGGMVNMLIEGLLGG